MKSSEAIGNLAAGLAAAQAEIKHAVKSSENPFFKSHYADLASVVDACRASLAKNGLAVVQGADSSPGDVSTVCVSTRLVHKSGEWIESTLNVKPVKSDPQGIGSAITYARRYMLAAMVGVATEDDDGNGASHGNDRQQPQAKQPPRQQGPSLADDATFLDATDAAYHESGFTPSQAVACNSAQVAKLKLKSLHELPAARRAAFIEAIRSGKLDNFKQSAAA